MSPLWRSVQPGTDRHSRVFAEGTPYQGGYFRVKFDFTEEFPAAPPKCTVALPRIWSAALMSSLRSIHHQDFPSKRLERRGDLCEHPQKRLEVVVWHWAHPRHYQVPPYLPKSRLSIRRRGRKVATRELRELLRASKAHHECTRDTKGMSSDAISYRSTGTANLSPVFSLGPSTRICCADSSN